MTRTMSTETTIEGDDTLPLRMYSLDGAGTSHHRIEIHYVKCWEDGVRLVTEQGFGEGLDFAELQERNPDDRTDWISWMDDRGCDFDEVLEEWRESNPDGFNETLQEAFKRLG